MCIIPRRKSFKKNKCKSKKKDVVLFPLIGYTLYMYL